MTKTRTQLLSGPELARRLADHSDDEPLLLFDVRQGEAGRTADLQGPLPGG